VKLLHCNIWQGRLAGNFLKLVEKEQPDILCLQEVFSTQGVVKIPEYMFDVLEQILAKTGFEHHYFSPAFTSEYAGTKADFGNAIVSRYPIHDAQTVFTEGAYDSTVLTTTENYTNNIRNVQLVRLETPAGDLHIANHHAHWEKTPEGSEQSVQSMSVVVEAIDKLSGPRILSGDMNVRANTPTMQLFKGRLRNLTEENNLQTTLSIVGKAVDVACDHILVSEEIQVKAYRVADELVSDHKALILEFDL
jgi:endonuclease/exonuclease/phosphatase family metal-dependent hydrolase